MRPRTGAGVALCLVLAGSACSASTGADSPEGILLRHLDRADKTSLAFRYAEETEEQNLRVDGVIADDHRMTGTVRIDGAEAYEFIVSDDALALRFLSPQAALPVADRVLSQALEEGRWAIDYVGAPPVVAPVSREGTIRTGQSPVTDVLSVFQYARRAIDQGAGVSEHNPDALDYIRQDDPFAGMTEKSLSRDRGFRRFDVEPPNLPSEAERGAAQMPPGTEHFRKMSFFVKGRDLVRIVEEVSLERTEFRRAREGRESERFLRLLESVRSGGTREPLRLRSVSLVMSALGREQAVELPVDAEAGDLGDVLEGRA